MAKKRDGSQDKGLLANLKYVPKRQLSEIEKQIILIAIERAKIQRERAMALLNKGFFIFIMFIIIAYLNRFTNISSQLTMNIMFIVAIVVLVVIIFTYETALAKEEKELDELLEGFVK